MSGFPELFTRIWFGISANFPVLFWNSRFLSEKDKKKNKTKQKTKNKKTKKQKTKTNKQTNKTKQKKETKKQTKKTLTETQDEKSLFHMLLRLLLWNKEKVWMWK